MERINVGCGRDIKVGWINLDQHSKNGADCIFNLNELFKGNKMPFPDNHFDYVYCSHVIEDFWEPMVIIKELFRICKVGGKVELRAPTEANLHLTNIYHKIPFSLFKFQSLVTHYSEYGEDFKVEIVELCYYAQYNRGKLYNSFLKANVFFYNLIDFRIIEHTFLKYLLNFVDCKVIYRKVA